MLPRSAQVMRGVSLQSRVIVLAGRNSPNIGGRKERGGDWNRGSGLRIVLTLS